MEPELCFLPPELLILHCSKHADAFVAATAIREQKSVLINTQAMEPKAAQRLLDFVAGAVHALSGNALRIFLAAAFCFALPNCGLVPLRRRLTQLPAAPRVEITLFLTSLLPRAAT